MVTFSGQRSVTWPRVPFHTTDSVGRCGLLATMGTPSVICISLLMSILLARTLSPTRRWTRMHVAFRCAGAPSNRGVYTQQCWFKTCSVRAYPILHTQCVDSANGASSIPSLTHCHEAILSNSRILQRSTKYYQFYKCFWHEKSHSVAWRELYKKIRTL